MRHGLLPLEPIFNPEKIKGGVAIGNTPSGPPSPVCLTGYTDDFASGIDPTYWIDNLGMAASSGAVVSTLVGSNNMTLTPSMCAHAGGYYAEYDVLSTTSGKQNDLIFEDANDGWVGKLNGSNQWQLSSNAGTVTLGSGAPSVPWRFRMEIYSVTSTLVRVNLYSGSVGVTPTTLRGTVLRAGSIGTLTTDILIGSINAGVILDNFECGQFAPTPIVPVAPGSPTHWWKCDEASGNLADSGTSPVSATQNGTPTYSQLIGTHPAILMSPGNRFTAAAAAPANNQPMSMFAMVEAAVPVTNHGIVFSSHPTGNLFERGFTLGILTGGQIYGIVAVNGSTRALVQSEAGIYTAGAHTIGMSYTVGQVQLYLDGIEVASAPYAGGVIYGADMRFSGSQATVGTAGWADLTGELANVQTWNNTFITAANFAWLHDNSGL